LGIPKPSGLKTYNHKFRDFSQNNIIQQKDRDELAMNKGKKNYALQKSSIPTLLNEKEPARVATRGDATPNILEQRADKQEYKKQ
jgi:hypothetical protein